MIDLIVGIKQGKRLAVGVSMYAKTFCTSISQYVYQEGILIVATSCNLNEVFKVCKEAFYLIANNNT